MMLASTAYGAEQFTFMPKMIIEQLCDTDKTGCRYFIGGVAGALYYSAKGVICFPMKEANGFLTIDLDQIMKTAQYGLSKVSFDEDAAPVLFSVWRAAYPCDPVKNR